MHSRLVGRVHESQKIDDKPSTISNHQIDAQKHNHTWKVLKKSVTTARAVIKKMDSYFQILGLILNAQDTIS